MKKKKWKSVEREREIKKESECQRSLISWATISGSLVVLYTVEIKIHVSCIYNLTEMDLESDYN